MKIFLSWSGETSKLVASHLHQWLPLIFPDVQIWISTRDIHAGQRWGNELDEQLEATDFGIICVVPSNLLAPWLLFEAGALSKSVESGRVVPFCLGIGADEVQGPLSRFQGVAADKEGTRRLVDSINSTMIPPRKETDLGILFDSLWPLLERQLTAVPSTSVAGPRLVNVERILCAATTQFEELDAAGDMGIIEENYPETLVKIDRATLSEVRDALALNRYEIVHLLGYVDTKSGEFVFSDNQRLSAEGLRKLLEKAGTELLFLATCDSLTLGAIVSRSMSVIAASDNIDTKSMLDWENCFYGLLASGSSLTTAYDLALATTDLPMRLLIRNDTVFLPPKPAQSKS